LEMIFIDLDKPSFIIGVLNKVDAAWST
jgi:hypothetical protein